MRFHASTQKLCGICSNPQRDTATLAVVASDADLAALERSGTFSGQYFVLGGTISLASESTERLRLSQMLDSLETRAEKGLSEVILAFPANPEGDATAVRVREEVLLRAPRLTVTTLGRGLSTGSELEYADPETLKSALDSRR
jgi:recombination protein RecR